MKRNQKAIVLAAASLPLLAFSKFTEGYTLTWQSETSFAVPAGFQLNAGPTGFSSDDTETRTQTLGQDANLPDYTCEISDASATWNYSIISNIDNGSGGGGWNSVDVAVGYDPSPTARYSYFGSSDEGTSEDISDSKSGSFGSIPLDSDTPGGYYITSVTTPLYADVSQEGEFDFYNDGDASGSTQLLYWGTITYTTTVTSTNPFAPDTSDGDNGDGGGAGSVSWGDSRQWGGGTVPNAACADAVFPDAGSMPSDACFSSASLYFNSQC